MNNLNDKKKIFILRIIIAFIILLIILFSVIAIIDFKSKDNDPKYLDTTTRRTYKTTTTSSTSRINTSSTTKTSAVSTSSTVASNTKTTTAKTTKSTKVTSEIISSPIPVTPDYTETNEDSNNANAEASLEWYIVNKINDIRENNGLNRLIVAKELRDLAETAGDIYNTQGENAVSDYLDGYNNYRFWTLNQNVSKDYLVDKTINATSVTTNENYKYVGVGVIKIINNQNKLPAYHYCIIYQ